VLNKYLKNDKAKRARRKLQLEQLEDRVLYSAVPDVTISAPSGPQPGTNISITASFDNTSLTDTGFGPYVDIALPVTGADGLGVQIDDGITFTGSVTFLGSAVPAGQIKQITFNDADPVDHPYAKDASGNPIKVLTTQYGPIGTFRDGDLLLVVQLPFGSFTPNQPVADLTIGALVSNLADIGTPLTIAAKSGFMFGNDEFDNPTTDPSLFSSVKTAIVTPRLITLTKTFSGPEGETATGPNYLRTYTISVDVATGHRFTEFNINDVLPNDAQFVSVVSLTENFAQNSTINSISTPSTLTPGGTLSRQLVPNGAAEFIGVAGNDITMVISFYTPINDSTSARIINAASGDDDPSLNTANASAVWSSTPDIRDVGGLVNATPATVSHTNKSIAIQNTGPVIVTNAGDAGLSPGDVIEYTLDFQISDYFAFNNLIVTDLFSDGQFFDATFIPTLIVNGNPFTLGVSSFNAANFTVDTSQVGNDLNPATDGSTTVTFQVSNEMVTRGQNGRLLGGGINPGALGDPASNLVGYNDGATTAQIKFRTVVQDLFTDTYPSGLPQVNQGDIIRNNVTLVGDVLSNSTLIATGQTEADVSATSAEIVRSALSKTLHAVNGNTVLPTALTAGDEVTYRLTYTIPTGNIDQLFLSDYLPLPVFDVNDPNGDGVPSGWTFSDVISAAIPAAGTYKFGPLDTYRTAAGAGGIPTFSINTTSNNLSWQYGNFDYPANTQLVIDIFFTTTVTGRAFANGLFLTNQGSAIENTTNNVPSNADAIAQILITAPDLYIKKGAVSSDNPAATYEYLGAINKTGGYLAGSTQMDIDGFTSALPTGATIIFDGHPTTYTVLSSVVDPKGGANRVVLSSGLLFAVADNEAVHVTVPVLNRVAFNAPGTAGARFAGTVNSTDLLTKPVDTDIDNIDAGDTVTFSIVVENRGESRRGAFDVSIKDTLPAGFVIPGGGLNLRVVDGTGALMTWTAVDGTDITPLFEDGIRIDDPGATAAAPDGTAGGALDVYSPTSGRNLLIITYDVQATAAVTARANLINTATLFNFAGKEGGQDYTATDKTNIATARVEAPVISAKTLVGTEITTVNNTATQAVIGELVTYRLDVKVPEGSVGNVVVTDLMDQGLAFVDIVSVTTPAGVVMSTPIGTGTNPANVTVINNGRWLAFNLGTVTNSNSSNGALETIQIQYRAVVMNTNTAWTDQLPVAPALTPILIPITNASGNQTNVTMGNLAYVTYTNDNLTTAKSFVQAANVTVIEPTLNLTNTVSVTSGGVYGATVTSPDAGDPVFFRMVITNANAATDTDAFDIFLSDTFNASFNSLSVFSVSSTGTVAVTDGGVNTLDTTDFAFAGQTLGLAGGRNIDIARNSTLTLIVQGTLLGSVNPAQSFTNNATIRWTSLDGNITNRSVHTSGAENDNERTGGALTPAANTNSSTDNTILENYAATSPTSTVTVNVPVNIKTISATSEVHTPGISILDDFNGTGFDSYTAPGTFTGGNNTWDDLGNTTSFANFIRVNGTANERGGGNVDFATPANLNGVYGLGLMMRALSTNTANNLILRVTDLDGTAIDYSTSIAGITPGLLNFSQLTYTLTTPSSIFAVGGTVGLNMASISQIQIRGDDGVAVLALDIESLQAIRPMLAVGEIVRYRLITQLPESTVPDMHIVDALPNGMQYIDDGTARVAFISNDTTKITSSLFGAIPALTGGTLNIAGDDTTLSAISLLTGSGNGLAIGSGGAFDINVSSSSAVNDINNDAYASGTDIVFKLGTIVNSDNDANNEYIVIEFNAVVLNDTDATLVNGSLQQSAIQMANAFTSRINGSGANTQIGNTSANNDFNAVTVAEPQINNLTVTLNGAAPTDAGDAIAYDVKFSNAASSGAVNATLVRVATTANLGSGFAADQITGVALTAGSLTIDGVTLTLGDRILVKNQTTALQNGVFSVTEINLLTNTAVLTRSTDFNVSAEAAFGSRFNVSAGTVNANRVYMLDTTPVTLNTTSLVFTQVTANQAARVATTASIGTAFPVNQITGVALAIDGVTLAIGDRVLVKNQATAAQNGMYTVSALGATATLSRATDFDTSGEVVYGQEYYVTTGNVNTGRTFGQVVSGVVLNTTSITFTPVDQVTAFDVVLTDVLPVDVLFQSLTLTTPYGTVAGIVANGVFPLTNANGTMNMTVTVPAVGSTGTITVTFDRLDPVYKMTGTTDVTARVNGILTSAATGIIAGTQLANTATVTYTSLPGSTGTAGNVTGTNTPGATGTESGERNGTGLAPIDNTAPEFQNLAQRNNYAVGAADYRVTAIPAVDQRFQGLTITADDTSVTTSAGANLVIGESVFVDILVTLPEGRTQNLVVRDVIPSGLRWDTTYNATGYQIITTAAASGGQLTANFSDPANVATPIMAVFGAGTLGNDGVDAQLSFGTVSVSADGLATTNSFVIRLRAIVTNVIANQTGTTLTAVASLTYTDPDGPVGTVTVNDSTNADTDATPFDPTVTVVEPTLTVNKAVSALNADAGDVVTYTLTISNTSGYVAYGTTVRDQFVAELTNLTVTSVVGVGFGGFTAPVAGDFQIAGSTLQLNAGGPLAGILDIPTGATVTITVNAELANTVVIGQTLPNKLDTFWTSTPGVNADERTGADDLFPQTGTPDAALLNNYAISSSVISTAVAPLIVSHEILLTNHAGTTGTNVTVGEIVTYRTTVSLPEGTTRNLVLDVDLPLGLAYIPGSVTLVASHPDETSLHDSHPGTGTTAYNGAGLMTPTATRIAGAGNFQNGDNIRFTFAGPIVTAGDNNLNNNTFYFTYQALVLDVGSNDGLTPGLTTLTPTGTNVVGNVVAATTGNLAAVYNATGGTGLKGAFTGAPTVLDGVTLVNGNLVLVKNQTTASQNGIYSVTNAATGAWERWVNFDQSNEITSGYSVEVTGGTTNIGIKYTQTTAGVVVNTSNIVFAVAAPNTFLVDTTSVANPNANGVTATLNEPQLSIAKTVVVNGAGAIGDAGDPVVYTITIGHTAGSTAHAYDLNLTDAIPTDINPTSVTATITVAGDTSASLLLTGNNITTTGVVNLLTGQTLTVTISGSLKSSVTPTQTLSNTANLTYNSLPDSSFTQRTDIISNATGVNDGTDRERQTSPSSSVSLTVPGSTFAKSLFDTNQTFTAGSNVAIGEEARFALLITLPEGTTPDLRVIDILPAGLQYLSAAVISSAAGSGGLLAADFSGTIPVPLITGGATDGADVTFDFGSISITGDNITNNNSFLILVTTRVTNALTNQSAVVLANQGSFNISTDTAAVFTTPAVNVTVVEPRVTVAKVVTTATTGLDAFDTVTYQVTINNLAANGATTDAFEVSLADVLPSHLLISAIGAPTLAGGAIVETALTGVGTSTLNGVFDIPLGGSLDFTFTVVIQDTVTPGLAMTSDVNVTFTSLDGASANERSGASVADPEDNTPPTNNLILNNYAVGVDTIVTAVNPFSVAKTLATTSHTLAGGTTGSDVVIGEVVTYQLAVTVMEGRTNSLSIVDTLGAGLTYVAGSATITNANGMTINAFNAAIAGQLLTLTSTSVVNPGNVNSPGASDTDTFLIQYQAVVFNVIGSQSATNLVNDADATATGVTADNNNNVTVIVREPVLALAKTLVTSGTDAGDTVTYTIQITNSGNAAAYDIRLTDTLHAALELITPATALAITTQPGGAYVILNNGSNTASALDAILNELRAGDSVTLTVTAQVKQAANPNTIVSNSAALTYTSLPGVDTNERGGGGGVNDYTATGSSLNFTLATPSITKTLVTTANALGAGQYVAGNTDVSIGELITYDLTVTFNEGVTTSVVISDLGQANAAGLLEIVSASLFTVGGNLTLGSSIIALSDSLLGDGVTDLATITLGTVTNTFDNAATAADQVVIRVTARAIDRPANTTGDALINNASVAYGTGPTVNATPVSVDVVESQLQVSKSSNDADASVSVGQVVTYTMIVSHTAASRGPAFDIVLSDVVPADLVVNLASVNIVTAGVVSGVVNTSSGNTVSLTVGQMNVGSTVTITFDVTVSLTAVAAATHDNNVKIYYDSLPADEAANTSGTYTADGTIDRDYGAVAGVEVFNATTDIAQDTERVTIGSATVSDQVWLDMNGNGIKEAAEPGIQNIRIFVDLNSDGILDINEARTLSDVNGLYSIGGLAAGTYSIRVDASTIPTGATQTYDLDGVGTGNRASVGLLAGQTRTDVDFGYQGNTSVGDLVWDDYNGDGTQNGGEQGIGGITLNLIRDINGDGIQNGADSIIATQTTSAAGAYNFIGLLAGGYIVDVTDTGNLLDGSTLTGAAGVTDPKGVILAAGVPNTAVDFGYRGTASLAGSVYLDLNNNGLRGGTEPGIQGVSVTLSGTNDLGNAVTYTATTAADGSYSFTGLHDGVYTITETTEPAGFTDGTDVVGTAGGTLGTTPDRITTINLGPSVAGTGYLFGEIFTPTVAKTIISTSEAITAGSNVAVGEIVRYRLTTTLPQTTLTDFQILENLPTGMMFLNDGTARVGFVSDGNLISSTLFGTVPNLGAAVVAPAFALTDAAISNSATVNTDVYATGTDVFFKLGNLANTEIDANSEFLVIEFNAIVLNEVGNQNAGTLTNSFTARYDTSGDGAADNVITSGNVIATVVEPTITHDLTVTTAGFDAGDTVVYTLTLSNAAGSATAFDLRVLQNLNGFDATSHSFVSVVLNAGATGAVISSNSTAGNIVDLTLDQLDGGESVTLTITATLTATVQPGQILEQQASVTYTSLIGTGTALAGSSQGATGSATGERNGSDGVSGTLNDYAVTTPQRSFTLATPTIDQHFQNGTLTADDTSEASTLSASLTIGETVTYDILVTLNEGETKTLLVSDALPNGLVYVAHQVITTAAGSTRLAADFNGTLNVATSSNPTASGDDLVLTFGDVSAVADNVANNNSFVVRVTARVVNEVGNISGTALTAVGSLTYRNVNTGATATATDTTVTDADGTPNDPTVTVVEPALTVTNNIVPTTGDAGDTVTITMTVNNTGSSDAFDVTVTNTLDVTRFDLATAIATATPAGFTFATTGTGIQYTGGTITDGTGALTFTFTAKLKDAVVTTETLTSVANVSQATSLPGANVNERTTYTVGPVNDTMSIPGVLNVTKTLITPAGGTVQIGDLVTYEISVTVVEGTINNLVLTDTLPAGLSFIANSASVFSNASGMTITGFNANNTNQTLTVVNPGNVDAIGATDSDTFTIRYQVIVNDLGAVVRGVTLVNDVDASANTGLTDINNTATVTVIEPALQVVKGVNDNTPDIGQALTYTITIDHQGASNATAYDIIVRDALPTGVTLNVGSILVVGATVDSNASTTSLLSLSLDQLALAGTVTITYTGTVSQSLTYVGSTLENNVKIYYDTQATNDANSVLTGIADGTPDRDYGAVVALEVYNLSTDLAQDTERIVINTNTISGTVYHDVDGGGTLNVGDTGLVGVAITLTGTDLNGNSVTMNATTGVGGAYSIAGLPPGTYLLTETAPVGYVDALETVGGFGGTVSSVLNTNTITTITIPSQSNATQGGYNFGEVLPSSLAGSVYEDVNNNASRNVGEPGIQSVTITLAGTDIYGVAVNLNLTTDVNGDYTFSSLRAGTYTITEGAGVPVTYFDGKDAAGSAGGTVSGGAPTFDQVSAITLNQNVAGTGYQFGEVLPSSFSGTVFHDLNGNGTKQAFENFIPNVTVTLTGIDDRGNAVNLALVTDASGAYSFTSLRPSNAAGYTITESQPGGYTSSTNTVGTQGGTVVADAITTPQINSGINGTGNNFSEIFNSVLNLTLISTSEATSAGANLAVGEIGRFRLTATVPVGTLADYQLVQDLPTGLMFLNDGTTKVGLVSSSGTLLTSSLITAGLTSVTAPTVVMTDALISNSATTNTDGYASGADVFFKLGNLINTDTDYAATESVVIEFNALLTNEVANQSGVNRATQFALRFDTTGDAVSEAVAGNSNTVTTTVAEPVLQLVQGVNDTTPHFGQTITFTNTITHTGASNSGAFDVVFTDVLPTGLTLNTGSIAVVGAGIVSNTSAGNNVTLGLDQLATAGTITITYTATTTVDPAIIGGTFGGGDDTLTNNARATYTSTPGGSGTVVNATGSSTPGATGSATGERNGADGVAGVLNDYALATNTPVTIVGADLVLTKTDGLAVVTPGNNITYTITINNVGTDTGTNLVITDTMPNDVTYVSSTVGGINGGSLVTWNIASLAAGATTTVTVTVAVPAVVQAATETLTNSVSGTHDDVEPTVPNNSANDLTTVNALPDLVVTKASSIAVGGAGSLVTYTLTVTNVGNQNAASSVLVDNFDEGVLNFIAASGGGVYDGNNITWTMGTFVGGGTMVTFTVDASVMNPIPAGRVNVVNVANATFNQVLSGTDPTPLNNTASVTIPLPAVPDLKVVIDDGQVIVKPGQEMEYTVTTSNIGQQNATTVVTVVTLPVEVEYVSSTGGTYNAGSRTVTWTYPEVNGSSTMIKTEKLKVTIPQNTQVRDGITLRAVVTDDGFNGLDSNLTNNLSSDTDIVNAFGYDSFNNFSLFKSRTSSFFGNGFEDEDDDFFLLNDIEAYRPPILTLAPMYSGEGSPGSTIIITLFNAKGEQIGYQTAITDAGGNWLVTFPSSVVRDYPQTVRISQTQATFDEADSGFNMRPYFAPAIQAGHFFSETQSVNTIFAGRASNNVQFLYQSLLEPLSFGNDKYEYEFLATQGAPGGH